MMAAHVEGGCRAGAMLVSPVRCESSLRFPGAATDLTDGALIDAERTSA